MLNIKKLRVKLATHYYHEVIDGIYESSVAQRGHLEADLRQRAADVEADETLEPDKKEHVLSSFGDELFIADLTTELAGEMMVVALFKTSEISIKNMATFSGLFTEKQVASFYRFSELGNNLKKKVCDIKSLKNYKSFNELRCINNSVKHSDKVSKDLASFPGWVEGQKLTDLHAHYRRLKDDVIEFVEEIQTAIIKKIP